jgi:urease
MFGAFGKAGSTHSIAFVSKARFPLFLSHMLVYMMLLYIYIYIYIYMNLFSFIPCAQEAADNGIKAEYELDKRVEAVGGVRKLTKLDMKLNDALPDITVDPETYTVTADGEVLTCPAATTVPLSRNYFLF